MEDNYYIVVHIIVILILFILVESWAFYILTNAVGLRTISADGNFRTAHGIIVHGAIFALLVLLSFTCFESEIIIKRDES